MSINANNPGPLRVCVCTSLEAVQEPRAPRHALWLALMGDDVSVVFVDSAPFGAERRPVKSLGGIGKLEWLTHRYATRSSNAARLIWDRARQKFLRAKFALTGSLGAGALSTRAFGLESVLTETSADVYVAHNIETLLPAWRAARRRGARLVFDSMEFHSDMGDAQTPVEQELVRAIEKRCLPDCALVLAASNQIADALVQEYGIKRPLPLYNVPPVENTLPEKPRTGLALYWRNAVVGLGQRGLDEALVALTKLPEDVSLHLQGRTPADGGVTLKARIAELKIQTRVHFHTPYAPEEAVSEAAQHHVGLCLERKGNRNHDLTVSNKIFDYHMAGLAVIASDLPGLRGVIERSRGGLLFQPGSVDDLAEKISRLREDRSLRDTLAGKAREFALREGNREREMDKFAVAFREAIPSFTQKKHV